MESRKAEIERLEASTERAKAYRKQLEAICDEHGGESLVDVRHAKFRAARLTPGLLQSIIRVAKLLPRRKSRVRDVPQ